MEKIDSSYLVFEADAVFYLLSLSCVERIIDADQVTELSFSDFSNIAGDHADRGSTVRRYGILLKAEGTISDCPDEWGSGRETAGVLADSISGIVESDHLKLFLLEEPVLNSRNRFLKAAVKIQLDDAEQWGYLLDTKQLKETGEEEQQEESPEPVSDGIKEQAAQYLSLERDGQNVYIDRDDAVAIVTGPKILKVPMSSCRVIGISFYEDELVVYYSQSAATHKSYVQQEERSFACAIIFRTKKGNLAGIAGDSTEEVPAGTELTDSIVPLGDGVWGKRSD